MFQKMGDAIFFSAFMSTACFDPNSKRGRLKAGHMFRDNLEPVRQRVKFNAHDVIRSFIRDVISSRLFETWLKRSSL